MKRNSLNFKLTLGHKAIDAGTIGTQPFQADIPTLIKTRLLITANSGGGKSWLLRLIAEGLAPHMPVHIIDPEGDFATLREKFNFVLVGKGGETPADPRSIETVVHKLLELRASAVFDLYEMNPSARHEFVKLYARAMINAPKTLWGPTAVFFDEAHLWCPETGSSVAKEEVTGFATRGRKRGYLSIYATQRLSNFSKDASSQLLNRIVGGTFEDVDLKRVIELLSVESSERVAFSKEMRLLEPGLFYGLGRALSRERTLFRSGKVQTTHEDDQKYASAPPPPPAHIKALLPQLADLPKEAEEKLETEKEMRGKIRDLETALREEKKRIPTAPVSKADTKIKSEVVRLRKSVRTFMKFLLEIKTLNFDANAGHEELKKAIGEAVEKGMSVISGKMERRNGDLSRLKVRADEFTKTIEALMKEENIAVEVEVVKNPPTRTTAHVIKPPRPESPAPVDGEFVPGQCARGILGVLSAHRDGSTMSKIALLAGYRVTGGLRNALTELRNAGLMVGENTSTMRLTEAGIKYAEDNGIHSPIPDTAAERVKYWLHHQSMGECARKILSAMWQQNKIPKTMQELADETGYKVTGGFRNSLTDLRTAGVIIGKNTEPMQLNPEFFL